MGRRKACDVVRTLVPAHPLMDDAKLVERLVALLNPPFGRLPYAQPVSVAWVCEQIGAEPHHVLRAPLSIALEWDCEGERMWGRRIAAGDVFGPRELTACDGGRGKVAA